LDELRTKEETEELKVLKGEDIPLEVLFEDEFLAVINKPAGMMVHPNTGIEKGTLVNALLSRFSKLSTAGGSSRPGIVHRLDKETSGLMVIVKDDETHELMKAQFAERKVVKKYQAIVVGKVKDNGSVNTIEKKIIRHPKNINKMIIDNTNPKAKEAITDYTVVKSWMLQKERISLLDVRIHTGR
jgi:23S rRNA pseudouridine1911/1915/1917 synthase